METRIPWHTKSVEEVRAIQQTPEGGLSEREAQERLRQFGANKFPEGKRDSVARIFIRQFESPLIYILLLASGIVVYLGETFDAAIIAGVLLLNAIIGAVQEGRAQDALRALKTLSATRASVRREGKERVVSGDDVVPGDLIFFEEGEKIPADARLVTAADLRLDEASLTGESGAVLKKPGALLRSALITAEQRNMVFKGTHVVGGYGSAIVVATGVHTEMGSIAEKIAEIDTDIPLKKDIKHLSNILIGVTIGICLVLVLVGVVRGEALREMFVVAVALSVAVIPEGLPIVMTLVLATGVHRMSKQNVLIKRLQAVEALGQTRVVAVDKTGTLTKNEMEIRKVYVHGRTFDVSGEGYAPVGEVHYEGKVISPPQHPEILTAARVAAFSAHARLSYREAEHAWRASGDPTEAAILVFAEKLGFHKEEVDAESPKIAEVPFSYKEKYQAVLRQGEAANTLVVTGAPERVLELSGTLSTPVGEEVLSAEKKSGIEEEVRSLARSGLRVVAFAMCEVRERTLAPSAFPPLTFVGLFGINDALREGVRESVARIQAAGMRVVMITGDHKLTAVALAREAGIYKDHAPILEGEEIEKMTDRELGAHLEEVSVFARVTPEHKLRIIEGYRTRGEVVAMTGDGVNDAPSLVAADLGVAMGKIGTEVAKSAADIVLLDDRIEGMVAAAEEGRSIFVTIRKVLVYLFSTNLGEVIVILGAVLLGLHVPLLAAQIIWLNFVTDGFLVAALAMEPKEPGLLRGRLERAGGRVLDARMGWRIGWMSLIMGVVTLVLFALESDYTKASTIALTVLAMFQWFNAWNCRSSSRSIFSTTMFSNRYLVASTLLVIVLQVAAVQTPLLQTFLHTTALDLREWFILGGIALSIIGAEEVRKYIVRRTQVAL